MAIREIKATLALDGEKKFKSELDEAYRSLRVMDTGLKAIEASYGVTGDKSAMLAKKSEVLKDELEQQKHIVNTLGNALREAESKYGSTAKQTDDYRIKLNNALKKQAEMEKAIRDTERELDELGRESLSVGREIERGIGDAAEDAAKDLRDMYSELRSDLEGINVSAGISAATDLGGTIVDAASGLMDFAESSREYRRQMSFLERNAEAAGQDYEYIKTLLFEVASLTGEVDGAVEGVSNLLAAGFDASEMVTAITLLKGAVIEFPDTMKFESLADSLQETIATGEATGQYAELLGRMGIDLETFNKAMEAAEDAEERQQVALSFLANNGLKETHDKYVETNEELLKAEEVTLKLNDEMAELGGTLEKVVLIPIKGWLADQVGEVNNLIDRMDTLEERKKLFAELQPELNAALESGQLDTFGGTLDYVTERIKESWLGAAGDGKEQQEHIGGVVDAWKAGEKELYETMQQHVKQNMENMRDHALEKQTELPNIFEAEGLEVTFTPAITNAAEDGNTVGSTFMESVEQGMDEAEPALSSAAETMGRNAAIAAGNGINAEASFAISAAAALADGINAELSRIGSGQNLTAGLYDRASTGGGNRNASASGSSAMASVTVPLYMDSNKVGEAVIPAVSAGIGAQIKQAVTIG